MNKSQRSSAPTDPSNQHAPPSHILGWCTAGAFSVFHQYWLYFMIWSTKLWHLNPSWATTISTKLIVKPKRWNHLFFTLPTPGVIFHSFSTLLSVDLNLDCSIEVLSDYFEILWCCLQTPLYPLCIRSNLLKSYLFFGIMMYTIRVFEQENLLMHTYLMNLLPFFINNLLLTSFRIILLLLAP